MRDVVICEPLRTPVGRFGGVFRDLDANTLATDLLTVLTVDARWWDEVIGQVAATNGEGRLAHPEDADQARSGLFPFTAETVERLTTERPFQSAGAALLRHAWTHRAALLG